MKHPRLIFGTILILLLLSLMLYYSVEVDNHDPDIQYILDHYEEFTINKVGFDAVVHSIDTVNNTLYVAVSQYPQGIIRVNTTTSLTNVETGNPIEVYGTFTGKNQMTAEKILVYDQWNYNLIFIRSLPAIPFALYLFFRAYRFNPKTYRFERRQKDG